MAQFLSALLLVALAFVLSTDALFCPDGCSDEGLTTQSGVSCGSCQRSVSPDVVVSIAPDTTPRLLTAAPVLFTPASPSADIDHPPRS